MHSSITHQLTDYLEHRPSCEDKSSSASQRIPRILWDMKIRTVRSKRHVIFLSRVKQL
jgi:hypothetical protein